jgi:hypothetical protein
MNIAIVGSRNFNNYDYMKSSFLEQVGSDLNNTEIIIVSGGAKGADALAEKIAKDFSLETMIFPAEWKKFGKSAGFIRNTTIVENADMILAFPIGESRGTWDTIRKGQAKGIPVHIF